MDLLIGLGLGMPPARADALVMLFKFPDVFLHDRILEHVDVHGRNEQNRCSSCHDRSGKLAIHQACKMKQKHIVDFFLDECGFNPSVQDGKGNTCLHWACKKAENATEDNASADKISEFVESLLDRMPTLIDIPNFHQQIPLHCAAVWNACLCQVLVEQYNADVNKKDLVGQSPLILAARQGAA